MERILLTRADLKKLGIAVSNSTMLRMEAKGQLPKRRYLTSQTVVWDRGEIEAFLAGLFAASTEGQSNPKPSGVNTN
jgi:predicted DNA-binding transcriptional regulator AlpA